MPKKKNNIFDNRDAFEILRDAFWGAKTPVIAELGTRPVKARTVAAAKILGKKKLPKTFI